MAGVFRVFTKPYCCWKYFRVLFRISSLRTRALHFSFPLRWAVGTTKSIKYTEFSEQKVQVHATPCHNNTLLPRHPNWMLAERSGWREAGEERKKESDKGSHVLLPFINTNLFFFLSSHSSLHFAFFSSIFFRPVIQWIPYSFLFFLSSSTMARNEITFSNFGAYTQWMSYFVHKIRQEKLLYIFLKQRTRIGATRKVCANCTLNNEIAL